MFSFFFFFVSFPKKKNPAQQKKVFYQEQVAKRIKNSFLLTRHGAGDRASPSAPTNTICPTAVQIFLRRPFEIGWFTNQVATCVCCWISPLFPFLTYLFIIRCLSLWEGDRDLLHALELAKTFLAPTETLNALWPSPAFHARGKALRAELAQACASAGIPPPPPPSRALPALLPSSSSNAGSGASADHHRQQQHHRMMACSRSS